jgi:hypothetical protein
MRGFARGAGVLPPHAPVDFDGIGSNMSEGAPMFGEAGYSLFGPIALTEPAADGGTGAVAAARP